MKLEENQIIIDLAEYTDLEELANSDELFWDDLGLHCSQESGVWYIHDSNSGEWYEIEPRYYYASMSTLFELKPIGCFNVLAEDNTDLIQALDRELDY